MLTTCYQIQDDKADWQAESAQMHKVYSHSTLNLSASGAQDASEGFYFERDPASIGPHPVCPLSINLAGRHLYNDHTGVSWHIVHEEFYGEVLQKTAVFHRAWVFQERQLSKRVLHFGKEQVFWECRTDNYCESFPDGLPAILTGSTGTLLKPVYEQSKACLPSSTPVHKCLPGISRQPAAVQMQMVWQALVTDYSIAKLTYPNDKLVAISGMARDVWNIWHGRIEGHVRYIAGLWDIHLPEALLWRSVNPDDTRSEKYRAPTWSWATIQGAIAWEEHIWSDEYRCVTSILEVNIDHLWDEWGEVTSGNIVVKGPLCKLRWKEIDVAVRFLGLDNGEETQYNVAIYGDAGWQDETEIWGDSLYGLLIVRFRNPTLRRICMLVLNPVPETPNTFSRAGVGFPMSHSEVNWFDMCVEQTITIV